MSRRHRDALAISGGACNPGAIARSIVAACDELREEGADTPATCSDPAIRLMAHQLGWITRSWDHHFEVGDYSRCLEICQAAAKGPAFNNPGVALSKGSLSPAEALSGLSALQPADSQGPRSERPPGQRPSLSPQEPR